jgi:hypothetical protein
MWRLSDRSPDRIEEFTGLLRSLEGNVPSLEAIEVGVNWLDDPQAFDIVLITRFASRQDAEAYRAHPFHRGVAGRLAAMASTRSVVDFGG